METNKLQEIAPEPIPGIPISLPNSSSNSKSFLNKSINFLQKIQQYSTIPFLCFSSIHLFSVVITPGIFGIETGNDMIGLGRELYQIPIIEIGILISTCAHVISGFSINLLKRYQNYCKYGKSSKKVKIEKRRVIENNEDIEVKDIDEGLGGISSIIGAGSRKSITSKLFGLSPLSFSGYVLLILLLGHVYYERLLPLKIEGDSSLIDLGYVGFAIQNTFWKTFTGLNALVITGSYHMAVGVNRYLKRFSLRQRRRTYIFLISIAILGFISLIRISRVKNLNSTVARFQSMLT
ncbi:hypothetical protein DAPK24_031510 [Pichia kluyveri]|uniref:Mitochondrial adapter protein MCP1 transmembrane domain-containing protein n=1 Tax=Pichia kluyveri TaxID=36015 RepID=A0AAV5R4Y2_PICKL|nr:hypothetical protein DAPK24_031510 [Pichia kluyveri]